MYCIDGLDLASALRSVGGNEDLLQQVLLLFAQKEPEKAEEIRNFVKNEDAEGYTIVVHALKSSARSIGATGLAEHAYIMERRGQVRDIEAICKGTDELLTEYHEVATSILAVLQ